MASRVFVSRFRSAAPKYRVLQRDGLAWLREAHTYAEHVSLARRGIGLDDDLFREKMRQNLTRFGCGEQQIASRASQSADFTHTDWEMMEIYRISESPQGLGAGSRMAFYDQKVEPVFDSLFEPGIEPPMDAVHVTCTGYTSPSAAQRLAAKRDWGAFTRIVHAYHMGCYAAFPALRIAMGLSESHATRPGRPCVEIVHTEFCTLHLNPLDHSPEQLVVQSLFADGFIAYSVTRKEGSWPSFELLGVHEIVVPESSESMRWVCSDWGMQMTLDRDVPLRLISALGRFVEDLFSCANVGDAQRHSALFAIHPGGPKIVSGAQRVLGLREEQVAHSRSILLEHGNMSSATVPHIWSAMLEDEQVLHGQVVVSLAFGPGLTMCGSVMRKIAA